MTITREAAMIDIATMVFGVVGLSGHSADAARPVVYGTTFCVGPGLFVTAGHVLNDAVADVGAPAPMRVDPGGPVRARPVDGFETVTTHDVGLMQCRGAGGLAVFDWIDHPLPLLSDVGTFGFPHAISRQQEPDAWLVRMRAYKGHVITRRALWGLRSRPTGYETSCLFPKGLSGAPLLDATPPVPSLRLVGMVIGNGSVDVFGDMIRFGEALDVLEPAEVRSEIIGVPQGGAGGGTPRPTSRSPWASH